MYARQSRMSRKGENDENRVPPQSRPNRHGLEFLRFSSYGHGSMTIEAVIFDFDGVILDTETPLYWSWHEIYARYGASLDMKMFATYIGGAEYFDFHKHLEELTDLRIDRERLTAERQRRYRSLVAGSAVLPGVVSYLSEARSAECGIGLASNSDIGWVRSNLEEHGLFDRFDVVRTRDDVTRVKPDPEIYLEAARALKANPQRSAAIEDSASGIRAAKSAGLFTVAVPNPITKHLRLDAADLIIDSLDELPFERLTELVERG